MTNRLMSRVAQLVAHARVVGSIPMGDQYKKSMKMYALTTVSHSG